MSLDQTGRDNPASGHAPWPRRRTTARQLFVNLPVRDVERTVDFFEALGFSFDPRFTDERGACVVLGENMRAMLLAEPFFRSFIAGKDTCDTRIGAEALTCIALGSRDEVDAIVSRALAAGARIPNPPQDHGFMYAHGFEDLDGHFWEFIHMQSEAAAA